MRNWVTLESEVFTEAETKLQVCPLSTNFRRINKRVTASTAPKERFFLSLYSISSSLLSTSDLLTTHQIKFKDRQCLWAAGVSYISTVERNTSVFMCRWSDADGGMCLDEHEVYIFPLTFISHFHTSIKIQSEPWWSEQTPQRDPPGTLVTIPGLWEGLLRDSWRAWTLLFALLYELIFRQFCALELQHNF